MACATFIGEDGFHRCGSAFQCVHGPNHRHSCTRRSRFRLLHQSQVVEEESGPPETRTRDPLIKSAEKAATGTNARRKAPTKSGFGAPRPVPSCTRSVRGLGQISDSLRPDRVPVAWPIAGKIGRPT